MAASRRGGRGVGRDGHRRRTKPLLLLLLLLLAAMVGRASAVLGRGRRRAPGRDGAGRAEGVERAAAGARRKRLSVDLLLLLLRVGDIGLPGTIGRLLLLVLGVVLLLWLLRLCAGRISECAREREAPVVSLVTWLGHMLLLLLLRLAVGGRVVDRTRRRGGVPRLSGRRQKRRVRCASRADDERLARWPARNRAVREGRERAKSVRSKRPGARQAGVRPVPETIGERTAAAAAVGWMGVVV